VARYRLIDTAGSELAIVDLDPASVAEDALITYDGDEVPVVEVYADEHGREGGVEATLVIDTDN
jgi:hypothetical protein